MTPTEPQENDEQRGYEPAPEEPAEEPETVEHTSEEEPAPDPNP